MARQISPESIRFIVEHEEFLLGFTMHFMRSQLKGVTPEQLRSELLHGGAPEAQVDAHIAIAATACDVARRIEAGEKRSIVAQLAFPPELLSVFEHLLDAALAASRDPNLQAFTARPGNVTLDIWHWLEHSWGLVSLLGALILGPAVLLLILGLWIWKPLLYGFPAGLLAFAVALYYTVSGVKIHFKYGHLCAAKILSIDPVRVAAHANLHSGKKAAVIDCYVLKISTCQLTQNEAARLGVGASVPVVCVYEDGKHPGQWGNFTPVAVQCGTKKSDVVLASLQRIPAQEWADLDEALTHLKPDQLKRAGLYRVPPPPEAARKFKLARLAADQAAAEAKGLTDNFDDLQVM